MWQAYVNTWMYAGLVDLIGFERLDGLSGMDDIESLILQEASMGHFVGVLASGPRVSAMTLD